MSPVQRLWSQLLGPSDVTDVGNEQGRIYRHCLRVKIKWGPNQSLLLKTHMQVLHVVQMIQCSKYTRFYN